MKISLSTQAATVAVFALACAAAPAQPTQTWVGSWAAAPVAAPAFPTPNPTAMLFRNVVHLSLGGRSMRLCLSNEFGKTPLLVTSVHAALSTGASTILPVSDHVAFFAGDQSVTIPAGAIAISDPIALSVPAFANVAVSIVIPAQTATLTYHALATSSDYIAPGNVNPAAPQLDNAKTVDSWYVLKGVEVEADSSARSIVVLGSSSVDGAHSGNDKNLRWPDDLAVRLAANPATAQVGVLNEGISGGRLLHDETGPSALARLDRDVLAQPGAKYLIVSIGTNDIGRTFFPLHPDEKVTTAQLIWCLQQIAQRAHARGMKVIASTLNPFGGADYFSPDGEEMRQAFNAFVRSSKNFDNYIDFDLATRDPAHSQQLLPAFDSGDHLHANASGYKAMADCIDLGIFQN